MTTKDISTNKRECPFCVETINTNAKVCPRCRRWLTWRSISHPWVFYIIYTITIVLLLSAFISAFQRILNPKPYYFEYPQAVNVMDSQMHWTERDGEPRICLTGVLTNGSLEAWREIELQCRFYSLDGSMIDAATARASITVWPNADAAFRSFVTPTRATNDYFSFKLFVNSARNCRSPF